MARRKKASVVCKTKLACQQIIEQAAASGKVTLNVFLQDQDWLTIEGDQASLAFLGELLSTFAAAEEPDCIIFDTPGDPVFADRSFGIQIHRRRTLPNG